MVSGFKSTKSDGGQGKLILYPDSSIHPFYATREFKKLAKKFPGAQICTYNRFLGIIPSEISDIFPAAHNLSAKLTIYRANNYNTFVESLKEFLTKNEFEEIVILADQFMKNIITNNKSVLKKFNTKVFDRVEDITSVS
jgi:7-cyano-7-deazaguanine tRNA-ribosyltransferase